MEKGKEEEPDFYHIDLNKLHVEWSMQPRLYHKYADLLVTAKSVYEQAKSERDFVSADLELSIRKAPRKYGLVKVTDRAVEKRVLICKAYRRVNEAVLNAHKTVNDLDAIVRTLDNRRKALEDLVALRLADYFSEPRLPKGVDRSVVDSKLRGRKS